MSEMKAFVPSMHFVFEISLYLASCLSDLVMCWWGWRMEQAAPKAAFCPTTVACAPQFLLSREPGQGQGALGLRFQSWSTFHLVGSCVAPVVGDGWSATAHGKLQQALPGWGMCWSPSPQDLRIWLYLEIRSLKRWLSSNVIVGMGHWSNVTECRLREETRTRAHRRQPCEDIEQATNQRQGLRRAQCCPRTGRRENINFSGLSHLVSAALLQKPQQTRVAIIASTSDDLGVEGWGALWQGLVQHPWLLRGVMVREAAITGHRDELDVVGWHPHTGKICERRETINQCRWMVRVCRWRIYHLWQL